MKLKTHHIHQFVLKLMIPTALYAAVFSNPLVANAADSLLWNDDLDFVITPTRLRQNLSDVPASVSVLDHELLERLGITSIPEALRLVPGMAVGQASGNDYRIGYHGTNGLVPRRMQVLIDGRSIYRSGYAQVGWAEIPINIESVDRIEITRSPNAAAYGANSFFGVVNIITKHPNDTLGTHLKATKGDLETKRGFVSYGSINKETSYRATFSHEQSDGFDKNINDEERRDFLRLNRVNFAVTRRLATDEHNFQVGAVHGDLDNEFVDPSQQTFPDYKVDDRYLTYEWNKDITMMHLLRLRLNYSRYDREREWLSCVPRFWISDELRKLHLADPDQALTVRNGGGDPADGPLVADAIDQRNNLSGQFSCGYPNEDLRERQLEFELEDTLVLSNELRIVSGFGLRNDTAESQTFLAGEVDIFSKYMFANVEYLINENFLLNLGAMVETEESHLDGPEISPRAALNWHINNNNTLRFIVSRAIRTPDMLEFDRNWNYTLFDLTPDYQGNDQQLFYHNTVAEGNLDPETIIAKEISWYAKLPNQNIIFDLKLFHEKIDDLISEKLQFFDYHPTNDNSATLQGTELDLSWNISRDSFMKLAYAYLDLESDNFFENMLYARHSGSVSFATNFTKSFTMGASYTGSSYIAGSSFDKTELFLQYREKLYDNPLNVSVLVRRVPEESEYISSESFNVVNKYDDEVQYFFNLEYKY